MKTSALAWLGVAGLGLFLLLGNLFATYPELKGGVVKVLLVLAIAAAIVIAVHFASVRSQNPEVQFDRRPLIGLGVIVLLLMMVGAV